MLCENEDARPLVCSVPLNTFAGVDVDQTFTLKIDSGGNAGIDFTNLSEVLLLLEYEATL